MSQVLFFAFLFVFCFVRALVFKAWKTHLLCHGMEPVGGWVGVVFAVKMEATRRAFFLF